MSHEPVAFNSVSVGDNLPPLDIPVTTALVVGGAIASRDFTPVHHDKAWANNAGMPDIIMNILTTQGLVSRFVTDWAGINALVKDISVKLGAPNHPGDTMKMSGTVSEKNESENTVTVEVTGSNSWGDHVNATVNVALVEAGRA